MRKILLTTVCAAGLMSQSAMAEEGNWYMGVEGAYSILGKEKAKGTPLDLKTSFKDGWAIGGQIGYDFGSIRLEGEIGKHFHNVNRFNISNDGGLGLGGVGNVAATGNSRLTNFMMNVVYDFGKSDVDRSFEPFIGAGIGLGDLDLNNLATSGGVMTNSSDTVFAYQAFAGVRVPIATAFEMSFKYRYLATSDTTMNDRLGNRFKASYGAHDILLGFTYHFGGGKKKHVENMPKPVPVAAVEPEPVVETVAEPEPVVVPDPMPEPAAGPIIDKGPYEVYFDWDSSLITEAAQDTIATVVTEAEKAKEIIIKLSGYADRSGSVSYNEKLSLKRAEVVKNALVNSGIDGSAISIRSYGEMMGKVETADGVKEAQNRRVLIILE